MSSAHQSEVVLEVWEHMWSATIVEVWVCNWASTMTKFQEFVINLRLMVLCMMCTRNNLGDFAWVRKIRYGAITIHMNTERVSKTVCWGDWNWNNRCTPDPQNWEVEMSCSRAVTWNGLRQFWLLNSFVNGFKGRWMHNLFDLMRQNWTSVRLFLWRDNY